MKYKAKITVEYEIEVEDIIGVTQEDIINYKDVFQDTYFNDSEEIEDVEDLILAELENAICASVPFSTLNTNKAFKIKPKMEVCDVEIDHI